MPKEYEFRPDSAHTDSLDKIFLSQRQRFSLLRWTLYALFFLLCLIVQDVVLYRVDYYGGGTDLVPFVILMITALEGGETGCIFALLSSLVYYFSGSAPGPYMIPAITAIAVFGAIFRQACLPRGFFSILLCTTLGLALYEMILFGMGVFLGNIPLQRLQPMALTALYTQAAMPICYPIARVIGKIGGEVWKE